MTCCNNCKCFNYWLFKWPFTIPLGGLIGFFISLYGYGNFFMENYKQLITDFESIGLNAPTINDISLNTIVYYIIIAVAVANTLVCLYGFREKVRICFNCCHHINFCLCVVLKFNFKALISLVVVLAMALALILMVLFEFVFTLFYAINLVCGTDAVTAIGDMLAAAGAGNATSGIDAQCDIAKDITALDGSLMQCWIGTMLIVVGQIIICGYWMKYSTLANVSPYWTTGENAPGADEEPAVEMTLTQSDIEAPKAPRKF